MTIALAEGALRLEAARQAKIGLLAETFDLMPQETRAFGVALRSIGDDFDFLTVGELRNVVNKAVSDAIARGDLSSLGGLYTIADPAIEE